MRDRPVSLSLLCRPLPSCFVCEEKTRKWAIVPGNTITSTRSASLLLGRVTSSCLSRTRSFFFFFFSRALKHERSKSSTAHGPTRLMGETKRVREPTYLLIAPSILDRAAFRRNFLSLAFFFYISLAVVCFSLSSDLLVREREGKKKTHI